MDRDKPTWKRQDLYYTGIIGRRRGRGKLHFHFKKLLFSFIWSRCGKCESEGSQSKNKCSESSGQVLSLCFVSSISFCHCPWSGEVTFSSGRERQNIRHSHFTTLLTDKYRHVYKALWTILYAEGPILYYINTCCWAYSYTKACTLHMYLSLSVFLFGVLSLFCVVI